MTKSLSLDLFIDSNEEWRDIINFRGYQISNYGRVKSFIKPDVSNKRVYLDVGRILKGGLDKDGYRRIVLCSEDKSRKSIKMYQLVCLHWLGPRPQNLVVTHLDGNKNNDCLDNLAYRTQYDNIQDKKIHGTNTFGEKHHSSKITENDAINIKKSELSYLELSKIYNIKKAQICAIKLGRAWKHLDY